MVRMTWMERPVFVVASGLRAIRTDTSGTDGAVVLEYEDGQTVFVDGTPDEVHAALFPDGSGVQLPDLVDALDPRTYAAEWQDHSPQSVRAMCHALGLVRARLGISLDMTQEKKR